MHRSRRLRPFRLLAPERRRAVEAAVLFHACRAVLAVVPVGRLRPLLGEAGPPDAPPEGPPAAPPATWAVRRALRRAARATPDSCLAQALAGRLMLRRRGLASALSLGVREGDGGLEFHAWLRSGGLLVNGPPPRDYAVLQTFHDRPPASAAALS